MAKRSKGTTKEKPEQKTAQVRWDVKPDTPSYYVNFVGVSHTPYDFTLSVAKIPSPLTEEQAALVNSGNRIPLEPLLQLVIPPLLVDGIIYALTDQKAKYAKTLEKQVKNNAIQQHAKPISTIN